MCPSGQLPIKGFVQQSHGKRNFIRKFSALRPVVRPLTAADVPACLRIQERWLDGKRWDVGARDESTAVEKALAHFDALPLHGVGAFVEGEMAAFAVGEPLNGDTFVEHFEKALPDHAGAYPFILQAFARSLPPSFTFLNREQDLGVPGIRRAKESWHPAFLVKKYTIKGRCIGSSARVQ